MLLPSISVLRLDLLLPWPAPQLVDFVVRLLCGRLLGQYFSHLPRVRGAFRTAYLKPSNSVQLPVSLRTCLGIFFLHVDLLVCFLLATSLAGARATDLAYTAPASSMHHLLA